MHLDLSSVECIVSPKEYYKKYLDMYIHTFLENLMSLHFCRVMYLLLNTEIQVTKLLLVNSAFWPTKVLEYILMGCLGAYRRSTNLYNLVNRHIDKWTLLEYRTLFVRREEDYYYYWGQAKLLFPPCVIVVVVCML